MIKRVNARSNLTQFRRLSNFDQTFNKGLPSLESLHQSRPASHLWQQISTVNVSVGGYVGNVWLRRITQTLHPVWSLYILRCRLGIFQDSLCLFH